MSIDRQIFENLNTVLSELLISNGGWARSVREDFYLDGDSQVFDHEMPLIQITDEGQRLQHLRGRMEAWQEITVELWAQPTSSGGVTVGQMRDWRHEIERKIGDNVQLAIQQGLQMEYLGNIGPVRIRDNLHMTALFLEYHFYKPYTGLC